MKKIKIFITYRWKKSVLESSFSSFMEMYSFVKNSKVRYRVSLDDAKSSRVFRKLFIKSYTEFYDFYRFYIKLISSSSLK